MDISKIVITGAFGYSGRYIANALLRQGYPLVTLTNKPYIPHSTKEKIQAYPLRFDSPNFLVSVMKSSEVFINTY